MGVREIVWILVFNGCWDVRFHSRIQLLMMHLKKKSILVCRGVRKKYASIATGRRERGKEEEEWPE